MDPLEHPDDTDLIRLYNKKDPERRILRNQSRTIMEMYQKRLFPSRARMLRWVHIRQAYRNFYRNKEPVYDDADQEWANMLADIDIKALNQRLSILAG